MLRTIALLVFFLWTLAGLSQKLDLSYITTPIGKAYLEDIAQTEEGHYLVTGTFDTFNDIPVGQILKIDQDGELDTDFVQVFTDDRPAKIKITPNGKILINGLFTQVNGVTRNRFAQLNADGSVDESFVTFAAAEISHFGLQSDGKIIILGNLNNYEGQGYNFIARLNPDGTLDNSFSNPSLTIININELLIDQDDNIYLGGFEKAVKLDADGTVIHEMSFIGSLYAMDLQADGKLVVSTNSLTKPLLRFNTNGEEDLTFDIGVGPTGEIYAVRVLEDQKILVAGQFTLYNNQQSSIALLNSNGSFNQTIAYVSTNWITKLFVDNENNILVLGEFTFVNNLNQPYIARFSDQFVFNETFRPSIRAIAEIDKLAIQSDGKVWISGNTIGVANNSEILLRLNPDGSVDQQLGDLSGLTSGSITAMAIQNGQHLILAGDFLSGLRRLARFDTTGKLDDSFDFTTNNYIRSIEVINNKIYVAGEFSEFNGVASRGVIILNADGSIFKTITSLPENTFVRQISTQSDGKIIITGEFPSGTFKTLRLTEEGEIDDTFNELDFIPFNIRTDYEDNIYLVGNFSSVRGTLRNGLARLDKNGNLDAFNPGTKVTNVTLIRDILRLSENKYAIGGIFSGYDGNNASGLIILDENLNLLALENTSIEVPSYSSRLEALNGNLFVAGKILADNYLYKSGLSKILFPPEGPFENITSHTTETAASIQFEKYPNFIEKIVVEISENEDGPFEIIKIINPVLSINIDELEDATTYYFRLKGINSAYETDYSETIEVTTKIFVPIAYAADNITEDSFWANWEDLANPDEYIIQVALDETFEELLEGYEELSTLNSPGDITDLTPTYTYYYRVKRVRNGIHSDYSNVISVTLPIYSVIAFEPDPAYVYESSFIAQWDLVDNTDEYILQLSLDEDFESLVEGYENFSVSETSYELDDLIPSFTYYYRVKRVRKEIHSEFSNIISVTMLFYTAVADPASDITINSFVANWSDFEDADSFILQVGLDENFDSFLPDYESFQTTEFSQEIRDLNPFSNYFYRIQRIKKGQFSEFSNTASVYTKMLPPTDLEAVFNGFFVNLSWSDNNEGESGFIIERAEGDESDFSEIVRLGPNSTSFEDSEIVYAQSYIYRVSTFHSKTSSDFTEPVNISIIVGIEKNSTVKIFPNPTSDYLHLETKRNSDQYSINLVTSTGKSVETNQEFLSDNKIRLDLRPLNRGIYILELRSINEIERIKVFKN